MVLHAMAKLFYVSLVVQPTSSVIRNFLLLMSICHTVVPEPDSSDPSHIHYQASSPGAHCCRLLTRSSF